MTGEQLDSFLQQHAKRTLTVSELLAKFLEGPANASQESAIEYRIKRAGFPTDATLESYDWKRDPKTIRREPFLELATGEFIRRKENAAFVGTSGYWNKAEIRRGSELRTVVWLESAVMVREDDRWKVQLCHSTRLEPDKYPKNIEWVQFEVTP